MKKLPMENGTAKESRLNIPFSCQARELLEKAASYAGVSVPEFVLSHALASAQDLIQANEDMTLRPEDFRAFLDLLDAPLEPNPALEKAFERHASQVLR
jgi:uncharacterized protein (DUF1778 family)